MAKRLLDRQVSLVEYMTQASVIFSCGSEVSLAPDLSGVSRELLRVEAHFSYAKRMEKIAAVLPRTFALLGGGETAVVREFVESCPPTTISRLENARQFHQFLLSRWMNEAPDPPYMRDVAACELACAGVDADVQDQEPQRGLYVSRVPPGQSQMTPPTFCSPPPCGEGSGVGVGKWGIVGPQPPDPPPRPSPARGEGEEALARDAVARHGIRRSPALVLLRCAYDIRPIFEAGLQQAVPKKRETSLVIALPPGAHHPQVFEVVPAIFDLLAVLDDWVDPVMLGDDPDFAKLLADLAVRGLVEVRR